LSKPFPFKIKQQGCSLLGNAVYQRHFRIQILRGIKYGCQVLMECLLVKSLTVQEFGPQ